MKRTLFIMDPLEAVQLNHDTTFVIMCEHARRGDAVYFALSRDLRWEAGEVIVNARHVFPRRDASAPFSPAPQRDESLATFGVVWMRKDPPVDDEYLYATHLLSLAPKSTRVVNDPRALRDANEKLYALRFAEWIPETLVAASAAEIGRFARSVGGSVVVKPLDGMGGRGVLLVRDDDPNRSALLEIATAGDTRTAMAQRYLADVVCGDKRILLLGGRPVGAINRLPKVGELRANLAAGGTPVKSALTTREIDLCEAVGPSLVRDGIWFAGIDVIGGFLTEVNVTSPTCVQEINRADGVVLERAIVDYIETLRAVP